LRFSRLTFGAIVACAALLILFATMSYRAALTKSATYDEPLHLVAGFVHKTEGDFRIDPENPALFGRWAAVPIARDELKLIFDTPLWKRMPENLTATESAYAMNNLYRTEGNNAEELIQESRRMFVILGVLLGALLACWSWKLAGPLAALVTTALFAFDPNFLAHSAIVKNDVMLTLCFATMAMALWRFGQRGTVLSLIGICVACAVAVNVKFSGLICGPVVFLVLIARAMMPQGWVVGRWTLNTRQRRLVVVPSVCIIAGIVSYLAIWASYGFRYAPTKDPTVVLNTDQLVQEAKENRLRARLPADAMISREMIDQESPGTMVNLTLGAQKHHLLPQAWLAGLIETLAATTNHTSYLRGELSPTGWRSYFLFAVLFKTPLATLAAMFIAGIFGAILIAQKRDPWPLIALAIPLLVYGGNAAAANLNTGLRHFLPMYALAFVATGVVMANLMQRWKVLGGTTVAVLLVGLAVESLAAYPNYIAFFNAPSNRTRGGYPGGFFLLSDSNLDWGQDLELLAQWRKEHQAKKLYLNYFGTADPAYYGIDATTLPGGWRFAESAEFPPPGQECYLAVSATALQGSLYFRNPDLRTNYHQLLDHPPMAVLGGTIFIYELPMSP
jgi:hypothetical protein